VTPVFESQTMDTLFSAHLFGELPIARISLHVIIRFAFLMWLFNCRFPEVSFELLSLSQKRDTKTLPFHFEAGTAVWNKK
jgi:hypothetical protein